MLDLVNYELLYQIIARVTKKRLGNFVILQFVNLLYD